MTKISEFMEADHKRLDTIYKKYKSAKPASDGHVMIFNKFSKGLQRHIIWEEEILFPFVEKRMKIRMGMASGNPIALLRMQHTQIKEFLEMISYELTNKSTDTSGIEQQLDEILIAHNEKEEEFIYPWIDHCLNDKEREDVLKKMGKE